jgi:dynactin complex subunit
MERNNNACESNVRLKNIAVNDFVIGNVKIICLISAFDCQRSKLRKNLFSLSSILFMKTQKLKPMNNITLKSKPLSYFRWTAWRSSIDGGCFSHF